VRPRPVLVAVAVLLLGLPACSGGTDESSDPDATIRFASYDFTENQILAEVYAEGVRRAGLPVSIQEAVGTREVVQPALQQGVLDVVVDYLGTAVAFTDALVSGEIDVGLLETTDARLSVAPVMLLVDDLGLQPHENVVPLVRTDVLERWGDDLRDALDEVSARLVTADLVRLNAAVELDGLTPAQAAARWWDG